MKITLSTQSLPYALMTQSSEPVPPREGELHVRMEASCINYHDVVVVEGRKRIKDGLTPLSDGSGVVEEVGAGVRGFAVGDRVITRFFPRWEAGRPSMRDLFGVPGDQVEGFAASHVTRQASAFTHAPSYMSAVEAATLPCAALTAWRALFVEGAVRPGHWVVTQGTGGVSIFALQMAKAAGARVICTSSSQDKLTRLTAHGADAVINYKETPNWASAVLDVTGGVGADLVVEVGGADTLRQSVPACRVGGVIAVIGVLSGGEGLLPVATMIARNTSLRGLSVGSGREQMAMVQALDAMRLRPVIDRTFPLTDIAAAFRHHAEGRHFGKICLEH